MQEMQETWVQPLGQEDPLEKEMATHSSVLAWRIPGTEEPGGLPSVRSHRVRPDWSDLAAAAASILPGEFHGQRSLMGYSMGSQRVRHNWATNTHIPQFSSVAQSRPTLQLHGLQQARLPCPSTVPGDCSNSCPSNWWCHPTISSSVVTFSSGLQYFPAWGSSPMSSSSHQVAKVLELQLQDQSFNEYSGLISFRMDWLDLLAVQGTLKSLLQHHSSKPVLQLSAFFIVQLWHPYVTTGKTIALTRWTFTGKVMSPLLLMLSRLVIALPRSKCLLISWLQSPSAVILEPHKIKSITVSIISPSVCHEVMGSDAMILVFWMLSFKSTLILLFDLHQKAL